MSGNTLTYPFRGTLDAELLLHSDGAITASGFGEISSVAQVLNFGGTTPSDDIPAVSGFFVVDISAIDVVSNDESYICVLEFSSESDFSADVVEVARQHFGAKEVLAATSAGVDTATGRYAVPFHSAYSQNGTARQYARVRFIVAGTTPTFTPYVWLTKGGNM